MLQHPVPDAILARIGDVTVSFAMLEDTIESLLTSQIREHQRVGQILSSYLSFSDLRAAVISLYVDRHGQDGDFDALKALMSRAGKIEEERNRLIHSTWGAGHTPDTVTRMKATAREKRGFDFQAEQYSVDKLTTFANSIKELAGEVLGFELSLLERGKAINNPGSKMW